MKILFPRLIRKGAVLLAIIILALFRFKCFSPSKIEIDLDLKTSFKFENNDGHRPIAYIFTHCSGSSSKRALTGKDILKIAQERGFQRPPYHFFIRRSGTIDTLCSLDDDNYISPGELCWGVAGVNSVSIHICFEGCYVDSKVSDNRTLAQKSSGLRLIHKYKGLNPQAMICGHRDYPGVKKMCPGFNAREEYKDIQ